MKGKDLEVEVPSHVRCPISQRLMNDPVALCKGLTYDRHTIETSLHAPRNVGSLNNLPLHTQELITNYTLLRPIQDCCVPNSTKGIERITTPKMPLNSLEIVETLVRVSEGKVEAIRKLRRLANESNRNRKNIAASKAASVLSSLFAELSPQAMNGVQHSIEICKEALGTLVLILHLNEQHQAQESLASPDAIACLVWLLHQSNSEAKHNAVVLVQEMTSKNNYRERIGATDGLAEGLVRVLGEAIGPATRKATVTTICNIARVKKACLKMVEAGVVPLLLEILVDADRGICERGLFALHILCQCAEGRSAAHAHALTVPVIVKKISRVSDLANELAVSILWNICQHSYDGCVVKDTLQHGGFGKLLMLVQVGCAEGTRERASKLLKLLNSSGEERECRHTTKRSFG